MCIYYVFIWMLLLRIPNFLVHLKFKRSTLSGSFYKPSWITNLLFNSFRFAKQFCELLVDFFSNWPSLAHFFANYNKNVFERGFAHIFAGSRNTTLFLNCFYGILPSKICDFLPTKLSSVRTDQSMERTHTTSHFKNIGGNTSFPL